MSAPRTSLHHRISKVTIWLFLAIGLAALISGGVASYRHSVAVAWLDSRECKFQAYQWSGWPCDLERRLFKKSTAPTWSKWVAGAQPGVVVSNWFNVPTPEDGTRLRPWRGMQKLHLSGTFGSSRVAVAFFQNLGPLGGLTELDVDDRLYDDTCTGPLAQYPNLRVLDIARTAMRGESLPTLPRLEELRAMSSDFTDEGCHRLATCRNLREIDLAGTQVTVEGVRPLLALPHLEKIRVGDWRHRAEVRAMAVAMGSKVKVW